LFSAAGVGGPKGIALDLTAGKVYWGQDIDGEGSVTGEIHRMNLTGTTPELVIGNLGSVNDLIFVASIPCPADFNNSGTLTVQDIFDFLAAYFANLPSADFNHSGVRSVQDLFDFLAAYFAGCP
jgi:hypothetical protein